MVQVLGSLIARKYDDELIVSVTEGWWEHFYNLGLIRTPPSNARREIKKAIACILSSPNFKPCLHSADHFANCDRIVLTQHQRELMEVKTLACLGRIAAINGGSEADYGPKTPERKVITKFWDRLCVSHLEFAFVEALIVMHEYESSKTQDGLIRMTDDQLVQVATSRHPELKFHRQTIVRLKKDYISSPERQARRFELFRLRQRGKPGMKGHAGTPSEYDPTGIMILMEPPDGEAAMSA